MGTPSSCGWRDRTPTCCLSWSSSRANWAAARWRRNTGTCCSTSCHHHSPHSLTSSPSWPKTKRRCGSKTTLSLRPHWTRYTPLTLTYWEHTFTAVSRNRFQWVLHTWNIDFLSSSSFSFIQSFTALIQTDTETAGIAQPERRKIFEDIWTFLTWADSWNCNSLSHFSCFHFKRKFCFHSTAFCVSGVCELCKGPEWRLSLQRLGETERCRHRCSHAELERRSSGGRGCADGERHVIMSGGWSFSLDLTCSRGDAPPHLLWCHTDLNTLGGVTCCLMPVNANDFLRGRRAGRWVSKKLE